LRMKTIFFPQARICSRKPRSLSVNGRSAEVTKSTRSLRGTKSRVSSSCSRMTALVPGVSTMLRSRRISAGWRALQQVRLHHLLARLVAVAHQVDAVGGGRHALGKDLLAEQRVDERALPAS
jgi:hypothetical protein